MRLRYEKLGRRLANGWVAGAVGLDGAIDWHRHGIFSYTVKDDDAYVRELAHISGTKAHKRLTC